MAAIPVGAIISVQVLGRIFGQRTVSTFDYKVITASTLTNELFVEKQIADNWTAGALSPFLNFLACCPQNWEAEECTAQITYPFRMRAMRSDVSLPGLDAHDATTANTAASIEKASDKAGRKYIGRLSIPALAPFNQNDGLVGDAMLVKMNTLAANMLLIYYDVVNVDATLRMEPCITHRVKDGVPPHWRITGSDPVLATFAKFEVRTQRSRNIGIGV